MNSLRRTNLANALFYIPRPAVILLPVLLRGLTVILVSGVRAWIASAWVDLLFLCGILLYVLIRWNALRYGLDEELLCIQSGVLRRELRLIPAGRITVVSAVKYLPLRPFGVFLIQADTPAGGVEWADFRLYLSSRDAARLFQSQAEQAPDLPVEHLYRPGNSSVLLLSLFTSNSLGGLLLVGRLCEQPGRHCRPGTLPPGVPHAGQHWPAAHLWHPAGGGHAGLPHPVRLGSGLFWRNFSETRTSPPSAPAAYSP